MTKVKLAGRGKCHDTVSKLAWETPSVVLFSNQNRLAALQISRKRKNILTWHYWCSSLEFEDKFFVKFAYKCQILII